MLKRRVKIFKWSVPIWSLLALFVVGVAVASFVTAITGTADLEATGGVDVEFSGHSCAMQAGIGTIDTCTLSPEGILVIEASGLDDDSAVKFDVHVTNNDAVSAYFSMLMPLAVDVDGVSEIDVNLPADYELVSAGEVDLTMYIYLAELTPNQIVDTINFQFIFSDEVP